MSMSVISYGNFYSIPSDLINSFPVITKNKTWKVVEVLLINDFSGEDMEFLQGNWQKEKKLHMNFFPLSN